MTRTNAWPGLNPGALRHRLTLEAPVETPDGAGGVVRTFAAQASLWGQIEPVGLRAVPRQDRLMQEVTHRITIRARSGITAAHRLTRGTRLFEIAGFSSRDAAGRFLVIDAIERTP